VALVNSIKHTEKKLGQEPDVVAVYDTKLKTEQVYSFDPEPTRCSGAGACMGRRAPNFYILVSKQSCGVLLLLMIQIMDLLC